MTDAEIVDLIDRARSAGREAGEGRYQYLREHGPRWLVDTRSKSDDLDIVGQSLIFLRDCRADPGRSLLEYARRGQSIGWTLLRDTIVGGYIIHIDRMSPYQELAVNRAASEAACQVLRDAGIDCDILTDTLTC